MPKTNGRLMGGTEDTNKCQDAPWLWMRKINIIKMSICPNVIYRFTPSENYNVAFCIHKEMLYYIWINKVF